MPPRDSPTYRRYLPEDRQNIARGEPKRAIDALRAAKQRLEALPSWDHEAIEPAMRSLAEELRMKAGDLFTPLRVAVTGGPVSPPLFESMEVLGRERCLRRIDAALDVLAKAGQAIG